MKKIFNQAKLYFIFIGIVFITILFLSLLNVLGLSKNFTNVLSIIIMIITFLIMGFFKGKNSNQKGYIQGLKMGFFLVIILMVLGILTFHFHLKSFLYYIILIMSSVAGAMLGINKKRNT